MPRMNAAFEEIRARILCKLLLLGGGKLGKTFYAALCAKAGFNVLYLDGDVGAATIASMVADGTLTREEAGRIYLLDVRDTILSGMRDSKFVEVMNEFTSTSIFRWNDDDQKLATRRDTDKTIWEIRPGMMDANTVMVLDSWTAYCESVMLWVGRANGVNVADASTAEMRPVYQGGGLKSSEMLQFIRSMPCHVIAIGHPDEYQHTRLKEGVVKGKATEKDQIVVGTTGIPKGTSKPQGLQMAKYFSDVAWMELSPSGRERRLSFVQSNDRIGGGHFFESKDVDEYSFINLCKKIGAATPIPGEPAWLKIIPPTEAGAATESGADAPAKILDGTAAVKPVAGIAGLFGTK